MNSREVTAGNELLTTVLNSVVENEEKLSVEEWDFLMRKDMDSGGRTSRFSQLMVPWSTNPHVQIFPDEGSHTITFVGTDKATAVAQDNILAFRNTCLCLSR